MWTLFATAKPFSHPHNARIQRNALTSWTLLRPRPEVILFGDEPGVAEICQELGFRHVPQISRNDLGTPFLNDLFQKAQQISSFQILAYVNADIILLSDFTQALEQIPQWPNDFLLVGQRWDLDIQETIDFFTPDWERPLRELVQKRGKRQPLKWVDYFVFPKGLFAHVLPLAIGRNLWDNWLIWYALHRGATVIDGTPCVLAIHQNHDYSHIQKGSEPASLSPEAFRNAEIMDDWRCHMCNIGHAQYVLTSKGLRRAFRPAFLSSYLKLWFWQGVRWTRPFRQALGLNKKTFYFLRKS